MRLALKAVFLFLVVHSLSACSSAAKKYDEDLPRHLCKPHSGSGPFLPQVLGVTPPDGGAQGGTQINIAGDGFQDGAQVLVGKTQCVDVKVIDSNNLTCVTSGYGPGRVAVMVINPDQYCGAKARAFTYIPGVQISPRTKVVAPENTVQFEARGGREPYTFNLVSGPGSLDANTGIYTAPKDAGSAVIRVTDALSTQSEAVITVNPPLHVEAKPIPGKENQYSFAITGGAPPIKYSFSTDEKEDLSEPAKNATIEVEDSVGNRTSLVFSIAQLGSLTIHPAKTTMVPGDRIKFLVSGGFAPYKFELVSGGGKLDSELGTFVAPDKPGPVVIKVSDTRGTTQEAYIDVSSEASVSQRLALGDHHSCAISNSQVKCWGDNFKGQLGNTQTLSRDFPVEVRGLKSNVLSVVAGNNHNCALVGGGRIKCWGDNRYGQLGNNSDVNEIEPVDVFGLQSGVLSLAAGQYHTCAVVRGSVFCWGSNKRGQLGINSTRLSLVPLPVKGIGSNAKSVSAGSGHSCALFSNGAVQCWGYNYAGQLGRGNVKDSLVPVSVVGLGSGVTQLVSGGFHNCVIQNGDVKCWGANGLGQLGNGTTQNALIPKEVPGVHGVKLLAAGTYHTCALMDSGQVQCWGFNQSGQLGNGLVESQRNSPVEVVDLQGAESIGAGVNHTCAVVAEGLRCWGLNDFSQFGDRSKVSSARPIKPVDLTKASGIKDTRP